MSDTVLLRFQPASPGTITGIYEFNRGLIRLDPPLAYGPGRHEIVRTETGEYILRPEPDRRGSGGDRRKR